jgi:hypothetical protein
MNALANERQSVNWSRQLRGMVAAQVRSAEAPRAKLQTPEKLQTSNTKNLRTRSHNLFSVLEQVFSLVLGTWSLSGVWILDLGSFRRSEILLASRPRFSTTQ